MPTKNVNLDGAVEEQGKTKAVGLDANITDADMRVTQAGRQFVDSGIDTEGERFTQVGRQFVDSGIDTEGERFTQVGRQIMYVTEAPEAPYIIEVVDITQSTATVNSSAYFSPAGDPHAGTRYQFQLTGGDWSAIVKDTGTLGAVETYDVTGLSELVCYDVRVAYMDDENDWGEWSIGYFFCTNETPPPSYSADFDPDDWAQLWNISEGKYRDDLQDPGNWAGPISGAIWEPSDDSGCPGAGYTTDSKYVGNVGQLGRLLGRHAALVNTDMGANNGVNVAAKVSWFSSQAGYSWWLYWDSSDSHPGVAALVCGTYELEQPYPWDIIRYVYTGQYTATVSDDFQGVVAYISAGGQLPYNTCLCCMPYDLITGVNRIFMMCYKYGTSLSSELRVAVYHAGNIVKRYSYTLPWRTTYAQRKAVCNHQCPELFLAGWQGAWHCRIFPWYGIRLKVWHDYATDPSGKTHRIQASATTPPDTHYRDGVDDPYPGTWGTGEASLPAEDGEWLIDETWVGGHDETTPGISEDGGLRAGWTGFAGKREMLGPFAVMGGGNVFKDFVASEIDTTHSDTPCDANPTPIIPPEIPPPELNPYPFFNPCPPDQETADKELYIGGHASPGAIFKFGGYEVEEGNPITARITPNAIAPAGYGGECLFKNLVVVCEHFSDIQIGIVPILNGERLDQYAQEEYFIGQGDRSSLQRYEVPLYREFEDETVEGTADDRFKYGLRGAYLTFEMTIVDLCGIGLQLPGVWVDYEITRETQNTGVVYTEDLQRAPVFVPTGQAFMGVKGYNRVLKAASGVTDDGIQVEARLLTNPVSPAGAGGECHFKRISLTLKRWNANDMDLKVTPYIDGEPLGPVTVTYKATTAPVQEITEVDLAQYYRREGPDAIERFRHGLRGAWFHVKVETGSGLQEWLSFDGFDLDYDVVRESLQKDVR